MTTTLQLDSFQYRCSCCHKLHNGRTTALAFRCVEELPHEHFMERFWEADFHGVCACAQPVNITFKIREYPDNNFSYHGCKSSDAEMIISPKVREHTELAQF